MEDPDEDLAVMGSERQQETRKILLSERGRKLQEGIGGGRKQEGLIGPRHYRKAFLHGLFFLLCEGIALSASEPADAKAI